ncbi:MAG: hypothetical protein IPN29_05510 [Saprospiraceae bacterium]|nr:hypothetical protein [Saprospiraceae bacterium]
MKNILLTIFMVISFGLIAQIGINTMSPDSSSILHLNSDTKGIIPPRMPKTNRDNIINPATGLLVYQTNNVPGYYYNAGTPALPQWEGLVSGTPGSGNLYKIPIDVLPYTITQAGSYILTKNLTGLSGITITTGNVGLDLNHYSLSGQAGNFSSGILVNTSVSNITVYNGFIGNWGEDGISGELINGFQAFNLILKNNGGDGLLCGQNCLVNQCLSVGNSLDGFDLGNNSSITQCIATSNTDTGVECSNHCLVYDCLTNSNGNYGTITLSECIIKNVSSYQNINHGIRAGNHNKINSCVSTDNGVSGFYLGNASFGQDNLSKLNTLHGFEAGQDVTLVNNTADSNTGHGFYSSYNGGKLDGNNSTDNNNGFEISGADWLVIRNTASGNIVTPFNVLASNKLATVLTAANLNTNTNPFANISF